MHVLGHLLRDDLINPVKISVHPNVLTYLRTYVRMDGRTSTIKLNAATIQIVFNYSCTLCYGPLQSRTVNLRHVYT